jgi:anti-anti-sigma factor
MNALKITTVEPFPGVFSVTLDGPLDTYTHETLDEEINYILGRKPKNIIMDMQKVHYISSMGVGSLFKIRKYANTHKIVFSLARLQPQVEKILHTVEAMPAEIVFKNRQEMDDYLDALQKKEPPQ